MKRTPEEVANTIDSFVNGGGKQWDWDGFISIRLEDPKLEAIRQKCVAIRDEFPPTNPQDYCSEEGLNIMRRMVEELRGTAVGSK